MSTPRSGVVLQPVDAPEEFRRMARRVEEAGYDHLWLTDSSLHARDVYVYLALAVAETGRVRLGTAVTNPLTRHPGVTAVSAATVDELSGGRMVVGIGAGDRPVEAFGLRPAPVARVEAAIGAIRDLLAGKTLDGGSAGVDFRDAHLRVPPRPGVEIFLSASGPRMLDLAGATADGVILLVGLFEEGLRYAIERVEAGARRAGRPRPHLAVFAYGAVDEDEDRALAAARPIAAWFPQTAPVYAELAGLDPGLAQRVRQHYRGGEFQEAAGAAALLPPEFVRQVALAGGRERTEATLRRVLATGVDSVHVFPLGPRRMETVAAFAECWRAVRGGTP